MGPRLRDRLGRICGQRLKLAIGAAGQPLHDPVRQLQEVEVMCLNNAEDRVLRVDLTRSMSAVMNHQESAREI
jgi:hypothetical protein